MAFILLYFTMKKTLICLKENVAIFQYLLTQMVGGLCYKTEILSGSKKNV